MSWMRSNEFDGYQARETDNEQQITQRSVIQIACCGQHLCTECVKGTKLFDTQTRTHDNTKQVWCNVSEAWISIDTEAGMLSGISRKRSIRSNPYWFTEFCNSQCLSHFAAPFIVVRAETSVAESCVCNKRWKPPKARHRYICISTNSGSFTEKEDGPMLIHYPRTSARGSRSEIPNPVQRLINGSSQWIGWIRVNDPSAGSPTETLLRLLLPLSDKVH